MKKTFLVALFAAAVAGASSAVAQLPQPVPEVVEGFVITPLAVVPAPTALAFGPGDADGPDLYVTTLAGAVLRISLLWTPAGPIATAPLPFASGFSQPLGIVFDGNGVMYVSDSHEGAESGRTDGRVTRLDPGDTTQAQGSVIVDGLPNGRHNTNHLRFGPDGRLYIANGNPNDAGCPGDPDANGDPTQCVGGDLDIFPYSGAVLSADPAAVSPPNSAAILHWVANGSPIEPVSSIATHPVNDDFNAKVSVLAFGFRNIFGVTFAPGSLPFSGTAYTAMNGSDAPASQDTLARISFPPSDPPVNYGFPFCFNAGSAGGTDSQISMQRNPLYPTSQGCTGFARATALMGWHTCTTGLDFPRDALAGLPDAAFPQGFRQSVFVGECAAFFAPDLIARLLEDPANARHSTSHKVARVVLDDSGSAIEVRDFVTGLLLATDVLFGPDGAMYIADAEGILRVAPALQAGGF